MPFDKHSAVTLFWAGVPDAQDWSNLNVSRVEAVMMPFALANANRSVLAHLTDAQKRVVLRVEEGTYHTAEQRAAIRAALLSMRSVAHIDTLIVGCEPDNPYDLRYGSPTWGLDSAMLHAYDLNETLKVLAGISGLSVVSAGWTCKRISPDDPPQPGRLSWYVATQAVYDACDGNAAHIYQYGWQSVEDVNRFLWKLGEEQERLHKPLYLDEIGVNSGSQVERMNAYIGIFRLLEQSHMGGRVKMVSPFLSVGTPGNPPAWNPGYLIRDPQAYRALGNYMQSV